MERRVAGAMVMMLQVAVVAVIVAMVSFWQAPTYEASLTTKQPGEMHKATSMIWMTKKPNTTRVRVSNPRGAGYLIKPPGRPEKVEAIKNATHTPSVAKEVIRRLDLQMTPDELLDNLAFRIEKYPGDRNASRPRPSISVERTYKDTDRERAEQILDMVGKVALEKNDRIVYQKSRVFYPVTPPPPPPPNNAPRNGILTLVIGWALCLILKRRELKYVLSNRGAVRDATYYLWGKGYAYYLSLGPTISAKATAAVGLFVAVALSIASMVGGGGSKPAPFD
jgi:capsular polysaccharide biosynthesis protein